MNDCDISDIILTGDFIEPFIWPQRDVAGC